MIPPTDFREIAHRNFDDRRANGQQTGTTTALKISSWIFAGLFLVICRLIFRDLSISLFEATDLLSRWEKNLRLHSHDSWTIVQANFIALGFFFLMGCSVIKHFPFRRLCVTIGWSVFTGALEDNFLQIPTSTVKVPQISSSPFCDFNFEVSYYLTPKLFQGLPWKHILLYYFSTSYKEKKTLISLNH